MKISKFILLITLGFLVTNCSTMFNGGSQSMLVRSSDGKEGLKVEVTTPDGTYPSKLPATISATSSWSGVKIKVIDKCYNRTIIEVPKGITPSFWANIFNFYGFIIDPISGKMFKYDSNVTVPVNKKDECDGEITSQEPLSKEKAKKYVSRNIHWKINSEPQGSVINFRINSTTPEVSSTPNTFLERTPYEGVRRLQVKGLTHGNMKHVIISIEATKKGYHSQKKDLALTSVIQTNEISLYFEMVKK